MPDDAPTSERLDSLRARWEADRSSGVFLQLADEYRRLGRTEDAVAVLEEGLGRNPKHPAALVALGRCRLELGRAGEAIEVLEKVIAGDPTQMVAYRLLVEAYVEQGMPEEARQRLRVYGLLNDSDPEIAEMRRRIGEIERSQRGGSRPQPREPVEVGAEEEPPDANEEAEEAEDSEGACEEAPGARAADHEAVDGNDPFPVLADLSSRDRYLSSLAGDLFDLGGGAASEAARDAQEAERASEPEPVAAPAPAAATDDDLFGLGGPREAPPPDLSSLFAEPASQPAPSSPPPAEAPARVEAPAPAEAPAAPEEPATVEEIEPEPEPAPAAPAAVEAGGRPTVTLGRLYLRQGHRDEAAAIFREVLERDPSNAEARAELDEIEAVAKDDGDGAAWPLTAADLLTGWHGGRDPEGMTARKRHVLERYLERIRGRSGRDVH